MCGGGIIGCTEGEVMAASEAAYYVSLHIHPLRGSRLSVLLLSGTGTLCDAGGTLGARRAVPMPKSYYPTLSALSHLTDKRLIYRMARR